MTPPAYDAKTVQTAVNTIKTLCMDAVQKANSGHPGAPMGLANIAFEIFASYLRHDPADPAWLGRDRFVLSAGHASTLIYSMLHLSGYDVTIEDLKQFRQWDSKTPGHPEVGHTPGVETTTGPLGQGISNAIGMALAAKMTAARLGDAFDDIAIYTICSDGDVMEGVCAEASSLAGHLGLSNLIALYDDNSITIEGATSLAFSEDVGARYEAMGWFVQSIDGHDHAVIRKAIDAALGESKRPSMIVCKTHIAHGAPTKQDSADSHGSPLGDAEIQGAKEKMGWTLAPFEVPSEVRSLFDARRKSLVDVRRAWDDRLAKSKGGTEAAKAFFTPRVTSDMLDAWVAALPEKKDATRGLSGAVEQAVAGRFPQLVGGSADLGPSTKTLIKGEASVARGEYAGRNLHFGIREHGMGAMLNGMALFGGFIPYGATFLIFSDYVRPSVRLSALMKQRVLWIFTHDSILLGEDGPTHQPIEQLWALRLIPNLDVVRPADGIEVAAAWQMALERTDGPTAFALTRQSVVTLDRDAGVGARDAMRGLYTVRDAKDPTLVIVASGSEVGLAMDAKAELDQSGERVRVVSAPCIERFLREDDAYRAKVLPPGVPRVSIEAGVTGPWASIVGSGGLALGIDRFGASAPDKVLAEKYGMTAQAAVGAIRRWKGR